jgi:hypothetical protein
MRPLFPTQILAGAAMAFAATFGSLAVAQPAGAVTYTVCNSLSGQNVSGHTVSLAGCSGPTGGSGVIPAPLTSPMTISWANGGTSTVPFHTKTFRIHKRMHCAAGSTEASFRGYSKMSTGPARQIRGMFWATICIDPNENLSLLPGKMVLLQQAR